MTSLVRAERISLPGMPATWTVVGSDHLPIPEVDEWLGSLQAQRRSPNTIEAYARHVSLLLRWLDGRGSSWETLTFRELTLFLADLADGALPSAKRKASARRPTTSKAVLAGITNFLEYWRIEGRGPEDLRLYREARNTSRRADRLLSHVEHKRTQQEHRLRIKGGDVRPPIQTIDFEADFRKLIEHCNTWRDRLLASLMYDGGLRIGQTVGLRHEDLDPATRRVTVIRREDNANGSLSKQVATFTVELPRRSFDLYAKYLIEEQLAAGIESDYVLTNLRPPVGRPMTLNNARDVLVAAGRRAGVRLTPHTLRHTHATALAREGWTAPQIATRLGQSVASSADPYIHLVHGDIADKLHVVHDRLEHDDAE